MSCVYRHHLSSTQAHIVAGILNSNGVAAAVAGDIAEQIYGGVPMLDCVVIVPEEELEEAEAVLRTDFPDEPPDTDIPQRAARLMEIRLVSAPFSMACCGWRPSPLLLQPC